MPAGQKTVVGPGTFYCPQCDKTIELEEGFVHCTGGGDPSKHHNAPLSEFAQAPVEVAVGGHYLSESGPVAYGRLRNGSWCARHAREYRREYQRQRYVPSGNPVGRPKADVDDQRVLTELKETYLAYLEQGIIPIDRTQALRKTGNGEPILYGTGKGEGGVQYTTPSGKLLTWQPTADDIANLNLSTYAEPEPEPEPAQAYAPEHWGPPNGT